MKALIFLVVCAVFIFGNHLLRKEDRGVGITPWATMASQREMDERIRQDRVGPLACPKFAKRPLWQRLIKRDERWCIDWLAAQR